MTFARHFSTSSRHLTKAWMAKHVSDPYVRRSVKENYRARSAFKLIEMNNTYKFIEPGHAVIDMGAAPGAWSQVLVKQVNARILSTRKQVNRSVRENNSSHPSEITSDYKPNLDLKCGTVIALDRSPIFAIPGVHIIDDWNLTDETTDDCYKRLKDLLARLKIDRVDGILSDMCPNVTGCKEIDHTAIVNLQQSAFDFARRLLKSNGYFLCKLFHGHNSFQEMRSLLESLFRQVHLIKPSASRIESAEVYLLALQYHGDTSSQTSTKKQNELERMLEEARRIEKTMTLKRKTRNLPETNDTLADGNPRPIFGPESTINDDEQSSSEGLISITKISIRIKQIQNSIEQARTMLESMDKFKHLMPGAAEQREKLETIISNLEEQKASYTNLFDLITATEEERLTLMNCKSTNDDDLSLRRNIELTPRAIKPSDISTKWEEQSSSSEDEGHVEYYSDEKDLLTDINQLRDRLKVLREIYEKKYRNEIEQRQSPSTPTGNRLKNLRNIRDRLDELEQIVNYYQTDIEHDEDKEIVVYDHEISDELRTKQLELEQAKTTLNQLQQMIQTIQPSPKKLDVNDEQFLFSSNSSPRNEQIAAQHREIERLVESRQRLHTIQGQITSLHQTMATPTKNIYEQQLNDSTNRRPIYQSNESLEEELLFPTRLKQSNVYASDTIVGRSSDDLNDQIREITRCLSTFIDEQKTFNRQIEHRLTSISNSSDPMFNQLQQQVLTQGLIVNLNTAYREIAVLQSEINALQSENTRLASSLSLDNQYIRLNSSKSSLSSQSTSRRMSNPRRQIFDDSEDERQFHNLSSTVFNIQPSSANQLSNDSNIDVQTLDLQVKSIMVQLIPFMRFHINEIVDRSILNQIHERILFLLKQQPDSVQLIRYFQRQFSDLLDRKIEKYSGSTIRDCAADLIRDISDLVFAELVKYKSNTDDDKENQDEGNFNGHEHVLVNRSINNHMVPKPELENESFL